MANPLRTRIPDLSTRNGKAETSWKPIIGSEENIGPEAPVIRSNGRGTAKRAV